MHPNTLPAKCIRYFRVHCVFCFTPTFVYDSSYTARYDQSISFDAWLRVSAACACVCVCSCVWKEIMYGFILIVFSVYFPKEHIFDLRNGYGVI